MERRILEPRFQAGNDTGEPETRIAKARPVDDEARHARRATIALIPWRVEGDRSHGDLVPLLTRPWSITRDVVRRRATSGLHHRGRRRDSAARCIHCCALTWPTRVLQIAIHPCGHVRGLLPGQTASPLTRRCSNFGTSHRSPARTSPDKWPADVFIEQILIHLYLGRQASRGIRPFFTQRTAIASLFITHRVVARESIKCYLFITIGQSLPADTPLIIRLTVFVYWIRGYVGWYVRWNKRNKWQLV